MKNPNIAKVLKAYRKLNKYTVVDLAVKLDEHKLQVAPKTIYSWENGTTQPDADTLLILCKIYHIENILGTFGYTSPMDELFLSKEERNLVLQYRNHPEMQVAVKKLLEIESQ